MTHRTRVVALVLFGISGTSAGLASAQELPSPPAGFAWKTLSEVGADFLMPAGWRFKHELKGATHAYAMSPEEIGPKGFQTGWTLNAIPRMKGRAALPYAKAFIEQAKKEHEVLGTWERDVSGLSGFSCEVLLPADEKSGVTRIRYLALANPETNTLYLLWFESPKEEWNVAWAKGEFMMTVFAVDPEF